MRRQVLKLTSPIPPSVNHYLGYRCVIKSNRPMVMPYKTAEAKQYQRNFTQYVKREVKAQGWVKSTNKSQHYYMDCVYYFNRVDMDANNYFKCMADAITDSKSVWNDDTQLCERVQGIFYDNVNPRIEITITEVDYIGVLQNEKELDLLDTQCNTCNRNIEKCKVRKAALEGRVHCDIRAGVCPKYLTRDLKKKRK